MTCKPSLSSDASSRQDCATVAGGSRTSSSRVSSAKHTHRSKPRPQLDHQPVGLTFPPVVVTQTPLLTPASSRPKGQRTAICCGLLVSAAFIAGIVSVLYFCVIRRPHPGVLDDYAIATLLDANVTTFGKGVRMITACSHNDEMQSQPFILAFSLGYKYMDVDVFLSNVTGTPILLVGEEQAVLRNDRTLTGMYLQPLERLLDDRNNASGIAQGKVDWFGVYGIELEEFNLIVDFKSVNQPQETYDRLLLELAPLIAKNYITTYFPSNQTWRPGPIKIIASGAAPLQTIISASPRQIFFDAPLYSLSRNITFSNGSSVPFDKTFAGSAVNLLDDDLQRLLLRSSSIENSDMVNFLRPYANRARELGIPSRLWGVRTKKGTSHVDYLWKAMRIAGIDVVNADDLQDARDWLTNWDGFGTA